MTLAAMEGRLPEVGSEGRESPGSFRAEGQAEMKPCLVQWLPLSGLLTATRGGPGGSRGCRSCCSRPPSLCLAPSSLILEDSLVFY